MRWLGSLLVLVTAVVACSSSDDDAAPSNLVRSGSRLQARGWQADGLFVLDGFYDAKLGLMCRPGLASDGARRCVPRDVLPGDPAAGSLNVSAQLSSPDCSSGPLIVLPKSTCHDAGRFVEPGLAKPDTDPNTPQRDVLRIGPPSTAPQHYVRTFSGCRAAPSSAELEYLEEGEPLPASELAAFPRVIDVTVSSALHAFYLGGEDGSQAPTGVYFDVARNQPCRAGRAEDGSERCLPETPFARDPNNYVDDACETHALIPDRKWSCDSLCDPTTGREELPVDAARDLECQPPRTAYYAAGPKAPTGLHHKGDTEGSCSNNSADPASEIRAAGDRLPPTAFPPLSLVEARGVRLSVRGGTVTDSAIGDECSFATATDGRVRCLPVHTAKRTSYFADAACTQNAYLGPRWCGTTKYVRTEEGDPCAPTVRLFDAVKLERAFLRLDTDGGSACVAADVRTARLYTAGAEVSPATFLEGTAATR